MKHYIISFFSFFAVSISILLIFSLVFAYTNLNDKYIDLVVYTSLMISGFISSFILCKKKKKNGIIRGIGINTICFLILFLISCILNGGIVITKTLGIYILICSLSGIVGGILGVNI